MNRVSASFKIWVDADACPNLIKNVIFRLADNRQVDVVLVSNHYVKTPNSRFVSAKQVGKGFDEADNEIIALMSGGDLVVTGDLPLANDVIQKISNKDHKFLGYATQGVYIRQIRLIEELYQKWGRSKQNIRVLDWGSGKGHISYMMKERGFEVVSCDLNLLNCN